MEQSAADLGCKAEDFFSNKNITVPFNPGANAKKYYKLPIACNFISYGNNVVAAVTDEVSDIVSEYISKFEFYHCFETPNMHWLNDRLAEKGHKVCFMAEYYLPDMTKLKEIDCGYELRVLQNSELAGLYIDSWEHCLTFNDRERDVLAVGAYDNGELVGLAGCSADCETM